MSLELITKSGVEILYSDYRSCKNKEAFLTKLDKANKMILTHPTKLFLLVNVEGAFVNSEIMTELKKVVSGAVHAKLHYTVVIGVKGLKKILLRSLNAISSNKSEPVDSEEEAFELIVRKAHTLAHSV